MSQTPVPLPTGFKVAVDFPKARERLVNCFSIGGNKILTRPGIQAQNTGTGKCRGSEFYRDRLFQASGTDLIIVPEDLNVVPSTVGPLDGADIVIFAPGHTMMMVLVRGGNLFKWEDTGGIGTLTQIAVPRTYIDMAFMDGRWFYVPADGSPIDYSEVGDGGEIRSLNFFDAELLPDRNLGIINVRNTLFVLGEKSIELFRSRVTIAAGVVTSVVQRVEGGQIQSGYIGGRIEFDVSFAYVGRNIHGHAGIFIAGSGKSVKISNDAVDDLLQQYSFSEVSLVKAQRYTWHGIDILIFNFLNQSLGFAAGEWHLLTSATDPVIDTPWRAVFSQFAYGRYYVGDLNDDSIGLLTDIDTDYGDEIIRQLDTFVRQPPNTQFTIKALELDARMGLVPTPGIVPETERTENHVASQWQIATDALFTSIVFDSQETLIDLTRLILPTDLVADSSYYWRVRYKGEVSGFSAYSAPTLFATLAFGINPPLNVGPAQGQQDVVLGPILLANAFNPIGGAQTHDNSQWQVATDAGFTAIVFDSGDDPVNLTSITVTPDLPEGLPLFWRVRYEGSVSGYSAYSAITSFTTVIITVVNIPINQTPIEGQLNTDLDLELTSNAFSFGGFTFQSHTGSQWQVATDQFFASVVFDSGDDAVNLESITVTPDLADITQYWWRVRHKGSVTGFSGYSAPTTFTTVDVFVQQPANVTPLQGANEVPIMPVLTSSQFVSVGAAQTHDSSKWQVATDIDFTNIIFDSGTDAVNLTQITITDPDFLPNLEDVWWRVLHTGSLSGDSDYSSATSFSFVESEVLAPSITSPGDNTGGHERWLTITGSAFATVAVPEVHVASQWQVSTNTTFTAIVFDSGEDAVNLLSITMPDLLLDYETKYYVRVKYKGDITGFSDYSVDTHDFTTKDDPQNRVDAGNPYGWLTVLNGSSFWSNSRITISMWFKWSNTMSFQRLFRGGGVGTEMGVNINNGRFSFTVVNTIGTLVKSLSGDFDFVEGAYYNILFKSDTGIGTSQLYINDVDITLTGTDLSDVWNHADLDDWGIFNRDGGASPGTSQAVKFREVADVWADSTNLDLDVEATRRKFIDAHGEAVALGANGQLPTGVTPEVFFGSAYTAANWNTGISLGNGDNFNTGSVNWDNFTDA